MSWADFNGKAYTREQFAAYVQTLTWSPKTWNSASPQMPKGIVLHNTAAPTLAQWSESGPKHAQRIQNLRRYYEQDKRWHGGPHLFVSRDWITIFDGLLERGTHSPSFNASHFGIEMVGDYSREPFDSGDGAKVRDNAVFAMAVLCRKHGFNPDTAIKLHKEDPATTHDCPGRLVNKADVLARVKAEIARQGGLPAGSPASEQPPAGTVIKVPGAVNDTPAFRAKAPGIMKRLMSDLSIGQEDAAAILGNIGVECGGFMLRLEKGKTSYGDTGFGWCQWTGERRRLFDEFCGSNGWPTSTQSMTDEQYDRACYAYLVHELKNTWEKRALPALRAAQGIEAKTASFMKLFERPGVLHEDRRVAMAKLALALAKAEQPAGGAAAKNLTTGGIATGTLAAGGAVAKKSGAEGGGFDWGLLLPILVVGLSLAAVAWFVWPKDEGKAA